MRGSAPGARAPRRTDRRGSESAPCSASSSLTGCHSMSRTSRTRARTVLQHILPPRVGRLRDAEMVRHQIENVTHSPRLERSDPFPVLAFGSDLGVERRRVRHVVAVRAAWHGLQIRRRIAVAHTETIEVSDRGPRVPNVKLGLNCRRYVATGIRAPLVVEGSTTSAVASAKPGDQACGL